MADFIKKYDYKKDVILTGFEDKLKSQPNCGPTIYNVKGNGIDEIVFDNNKGIATKKKDRITEFTWRIGTDNGHPCVFITFTNISNELLENVEDAIVCLETNTLTKMKNKTISVFSNVNQPDNRLEFITWMPISEIQLNREYRLFIIGYDFAAELFRNATHPEGYYRLFGPWRYARRFFKFQDIPHDWQIDLNIRPTIRCLMHGRSDYIHHFYHNMPEYKRLSYQLGDEYTLE